MSRKKSHVDELIDIKKSKLCNICARRFIAKGHNLCFCQRCKSSSDIYRNSDWIQESPLCNATKFLSVTRSISFQFAE